MTLARVYTLSNFQYCRLVWMFCSETVNNKINKLHQRNLRCVYNAPEENLSQLLSRTRDCNIHTNNLQSLMTFNL